MQNKRVRSLGILPVTLLYTSLIISMQPEGPNMLNQVSYKDDKSNVLPFLNPRKEIPNTKETQYILDTYTRSSIIIKQLYNEEISPISFFLLKIFEKAVPEEFNNKDYQETISAMRLFVQKKYEKLDRAQQKKSIEKLR